MRPVDFQNVIHQLVLGTVCPFVFGSGNITAEIMLVAAGVWCAPIARINGEDNFEAAHVFIALQQREISTWGSAGTCHDRKSDVQGGVGVQKVIVIALREVVALRGAQHQVSVVMFDALQEQVGVKRVVVAELLMADGEQLSARLRGLERRN